MPISNQEVVIDWDRLTEKMELLVKTVARLNVFTNARAFGTTICKCIRPCQRKKVILKRTDCAKA
jgi:hypothetical protein